MIDPWEVLEFVLWLAIPTVAVVVESLSARYFYKLWRPNRGVAGSSILSVLMVTIVLQTLAQSLNVLNAYRIVVWGPNEGGGVAATLFLYLGSQILITISVVYKVVMIVRIASGRTSDKT